ncbi:MAG TPA: hypothetical protein VMV06_02750 [Acidimicrobiales bacterium]|nr:hypothetical protein [Acidimicrobiales bacterium]
MGSVMVSTPELAPSSPDEASALDPENRSYQPMSLRGPALAVLGIAVLIVVAGVVASAFGSGTSPTLSIRRITIPDGTVVSLTPATIAMRSIVGAGEPPADILGNLAVPSGSPVTRTLNADQNAGQFDRTVAFRTGLSSGQVVDVYRALLPRLGWHVDYVGSGSQRGPSDTEVLAKRGSGDGFYWEVGVVVSPTTSAGTTPLSLQLFEQSDDN